MPSTRHPVPEGEQACAQGESSLCVRACGLSREGTRAALRAEQSYEQSEGKTARSEATGQVSVTY